MIKQCGQDYYEDHFLHSAVEMAPLLTLLETIETYPEPYSLYIPTNYQQEWSHIHPSFTSIGMMLKCCEQCNCRLATYEEYWFYMLDQIINEKRNIKELLVEKSSPDEPSLAFISSDKQHLALAGSKAGGFAGREMRWRNSRIHVFESPYITLDFVRALIVSNTIPLMVKLT